MKIKKVKKELKKFREKVDPKNRFAIDMMIDICDHVEAEDYRKIKLVIKPLRSDDVATMEKPETVPISPDDPAPITQNLPTQNPDQTTASSSKPSLRLNTNPFTSSTDESQNPYDPEMTEGM